MAAVSKLAHRFKLARDYPTALDLEAKLDPRTTATPALQLLARELDRTYRTPDARLIISIPPQEGKTQLARASVVRHLATHPHTRVVYGSYGTSLARKHGRWVRDNITANPWLGIQPAYGNQAVDDWRLEGHDGGVLSVGAGAGLTGNPADLVIIDDPVKDREEADSETYQERTWSWWTDTVSTRLAPGASVVVIMCMTGDTPVLMGDGTERPLRDIRPGDVVATYDNGLLATSTVRNWANQGPDKVFRVRMKSGRTVRANARHPFLTIDANGHETWLRTDRLRPGQSILRATGASGAESNAPRTGAASQSSARGSAVRTTTSLGGLPAIGRLRSMLHRAAVRVSSIATASPMRKSTSSSVNSTGRAQSAVTPRPMTTRGHTGAASSALTTITSPARSEGYSATTATSQSATGNHPTSYALPLTTWNVRPDEIVSIEPCGTEEVFDLQIARTENFIANGLVSHNTRWHEKDLAGRLLAAEDGHLWRVINIPAIAENDDPLGRQPGEPLQSARGHRDWAAIKRRVGSRGWNALYQGRPAPAEGGMVKRDWWQQYTHPLWIELDNGQRRTLGMDQVLISADLTFKGEANSDYVVLQVWGRRGADAFLLDQVRGRWDFPETVRRFEALCAKWPDAGLKLIEDKANGPAVIATLRHKIPGIIGEITQGSKEARVAAVSPLIEAHNVHLPAPALAPWADDFVEEWAGFPNATNDDQVDAGSQALNRLLLQPLLAGDDSVHELADDDLIINY